MMHIPMQKWGQQASPGKNDKTLADYIARKTEPTPPKKTFEEWLDEPYFELNNRTTSRRQWWTDSEIDAAKDAWASASFDREQTRADQAEIRAESAEAERDKREHQLCNILARIYRDGGQNMAQHGTDEAVRAADDVLAGWIAAVEERDRLRDALQAVMRDVVEVGAELAQRKPLRAFDALTEASHIGHRQMAHAYEQADEEVRLLAVRLAAAAAKGQG